MNDSMNDLQCYSLRPQIFTEERPKQKKTLIRTALLSNEERQTRQRLLSTEEKTIHQGVTGWGAWNFQQGAQQRPQVNLSKSLRKRGRKPGMYLRRMVNGEGTGTARAQRWTVLSKTQEVRAAEGSEAGEELLWAMSQKRLRGSWRSAQPRWSVTTGFFFFYS